VRIVLLCLLVACGGSRDDAKPAPASASKAAEAAAATIDALTTKVCACKTKECATAVNEEMTAWAEALAKQPADPEAAPLELRNRMTERLNKFSTCLRAISK
jgi:hypothetical protein